MLDKPKRFYIILDKDEFEKLKQICGTEKGRALNYYLTKFKEGKLYNWINIPGIEYYVILCLMRTIDNDFALKLYKMAEDQESGYCDRLDAITEIVTKPV